MPQAGQPGPWSVDPIEAELRELEARLRSHNRAVFFWKRRGGGEVNAANCRVRLPHTTAVRDITDSEIAALIVLGRRGEVDLALPFNAALGINAGVETAPVANRILEAAAALEA